MSKRLPRCAGKRQHGWKPMKRGGAHEQCTNCQDIFPCRHACEHLDCIVATGRSLTAYFDDPADAAAALEAICAELAIIAPTVHAVINNPKRKREHVALPEAA